MFHNVFTEEKLEALRRECHLQLEKTIDLGEKSCAVDLFENANIADGDKCRINADQFFTSRWQEIGTNLVESEKFLMRDIITNIIPRLILSLSEFDAEETVYLFNEHYIVKLPHSLETFRWHTDVAEQLQMLYPMYSADDEPQQYELSSTYVSVWCPLDDCSEGAHNGTLVFPLDTKVVDIFPPGHSSALNAVTGGHTQLFDISDGDVAGVALSVQAGAVVVFDHDKLHRSDCNRSSNIRRVYYAQYSRRPIVPRAEDVNPLCFAIPCTRGVS